MHLNLLQLFLLPPTISSLATTCLFTVYIMLVLFCYIQSFVLLFSLHIKVKSYSICLSLSDISYSMIPSRSIHAVPNGRFHSFLWLSNIPLYMYHIFFIHASAYAHLGCFHILTMVNSAAMNIVVRVPFWTSGFVSLG